MSNPVRIAMWSGPRNISTAMMRSFGARADCAVSDEPFYGAFLKKTGQRQPMADAVIASMDCDWHRIAGAMSGPVPGGKSIWYQKHMPHHMVGPVTVDDFPDHVHAFLIRAPERVVASYAAKRVQVTAQDLGYERCVEYFERIADLSGAAPPVADSKDILRDPAGILQALCAALGIAWDASMLHWKLGPRDTDGVWAAHWYGRVIETTGFGPPEREMSPLPDALQRLADDCRPYYEKLAAYKIGAV